MLLFKKTVLKFIMSPENIILKFRQFIGTKGIVTWEKAGYSRKDVFAELTDYSTEYDKKQLSLLILPD